MSSITNVSKPSTSYANVARPNTGLIWDNATMTWNAQTDTWSESGSLLNNSSRALAGLLWSYTILPWQLSSPWTYSGTITNIARP